MHSAPASAAPEAEPKTDLVTAALLHDYILRTGKIETRDINAAIQLVASRSRANGYWREVFERYRETGVNESAASPSGRLLVVLTKMLERDGSARWLIAHPDVRSAWIPEVVLSAEVLDTIGRPDRP